MSAESRDRPLATALRDLCGWKVGMSLTDFGRGGVEGVVVHAGGMISVCPEAITVGAPAPISIWSRSSGYGLPDPACPANWGVWLSCFDVLLPGLKLGRTDMCQAWTAETEGIKYFGTPGSALLGVLCRWHESHQHDVHTLKAHVPPSVVTWWQAQPRARMVKK